MVLHRFSISGPDLAIAAAKRSKQGQTVHRFSISSPDLRIDAAKRSNLGQSVHRFSISSLNLRIDAVKRSNLGQSVHRFLISSPDLRIDAAIRSKQGQSCIDSRFQAQTCESMQPRGKNNGNPSSPMTGALCCGRSPCPRADSDSGTRPSPVMRPLES